MTGNTILITGGGSGIGRGLAEAFHRLGNRVIITGRRTSVLDEVVAANPGMIRYALDVTDPAAIAEFGRQVVADNPELNVLINNAGMMERDELTPDALDLPASEATIITNLLGPVRMTAALLPHMRGQPNAAIVNVTSGLAFVPLANTAAYSATKAGLHSYTLSLRRQLEASGVEVIELAPPGVQTDLTPGQSSFAAYMPLDAFIDEVMTLFAQEPTPDEILVTNVKRLRHAEADGTFDKMFALLNPPHG
ncbi:putative oxidoreductase [Sphingobium subterraneum]|uniref:Putative oxidoreductase n=2 Tax=Sphingobium subterraneum TaxID=627688 RepID=A0A841IWA6_9SPHN|nr:putative oxidoreductase [Sphingobium subterraneum]